MTQIIISEETEPYFNLALEEELLHTEHTGTWLYLWQNKDTVVVGRNQNPYRECNIEYLHQNNICAVRRLSGGGAVFHDMGNLNYTFLSRDTEYDVQKQNSVIIEAIKRLGINAYCSGRNDILIHGKKFSGQAYYSENGYIYQHGTIMVDVNLEKMVQALMPSKLKLQAHGISSVKSRVLNLRSVCPEITVEAVKRSLKDSFCKTYGNAELVYRDKDTADMELLKKYRSDAWNLGESPAYSAYMDIAVQNNIFRVEAFVEHGIISAMTLYSDTLHSNLDLKEIGQKITGCPFEQNAVEKRLKISLEAVLI